jgi:hypothetical protein
MFFVDKIFFAALLSIPLLVLIYFLHRKFKHIQISSLILWENQLKEVKSGAGIKRMPLPLKFFIELIMLILLTIAAAGPFMALNEQVPALTVILDDSFSMLAGGKASPREQAEETLLKMFSSSPVRPVQFILAGPSPRLLDSTVSGSGEVEHLLKKWQCRQASADLDGALLFARRTFGDKNDILILSDRKPSFEQLPPGMSWFAFGRPSANLALVNAGRVSSPQGDKCLVEIADYSGRAQSIPLRVEFPGTQRKPLLFTLKSVPGKKVKQIFRLPPGSGEIKVSLPDDSLQFDNTAVLLPEPRRKLRIRIGKMDTANQELLEKALKLTDRVSFNAPEPHLLFSGSEQKIAPESDTWQVIISKTAEDKAYIGPYTVDHQHPLCSGLQLGGVIWGASSAKLPGKILVLAGNIPLLSDLTSPGDRHSVFIKFSPALSTLQDSPNYPVLIYNLVDWRLKALPGLAKSNYRSGEKIVFNAPRGVRKIRVVPPEGEPYTLSPSERICPLDLFLPGNYRIEAGKEKYEFRINALSADESDLRQCIGVRLEGEKSESIYRKRFMNIAWIFLLAVLAFSAWHLYLIRRSAP